MHIFIVPGESKDVEIWKRIRATWKALTAIKDVRKAEMNKGQEWLCGK